MRKLSIRLPVYLNSMVMNGKPWSDPDYSTSNPSSVSLRRSGKLIPASEFFSQLGALDNAHEILCGVFFGRIRGRHIFTQYKNKALQTGCQFLHLEGAFHGAF